MVFKFFPAPVELFIDPVIKNRQATTPLAKGKVGVDSVPITLEIERLVSYCCLQLSTACAKISCVESYVYGLTKENVSNLARHFNEMAEGKTKAKAVKTPNSTLKRLVVESGIIDHTS